MDSLFCWLTDYFITIYSAQFLSLAFDWLSINNALLVDSGFGGLWISDYDQHALNVVRTVSC